MNISPNNCPGGSPQTNPALSGLKNGFAGRVFSYFNFDKVIKDTLDNDLVVQNVRQSSPYFGGSAFSYNNIVSNNLYYQYLNAYLATKVMYKKMETIRHQYLVGAVLQCLVDDALATDPATGEIFSVSVNPNHLYANKANKICKKFEKHFKIDRLINSIIEDAIFWGEYSMTLQSKVGSDKGDGNGTPDGGIVDIIDANPPGTLLGVWAGVHPRYFIRLQKGINTSVQGQLEELQPTSVWNISIFPQKIRLSLGYGQWLYDDSNRISSFLKVGRPLFYNVYNKILELEAFEQAQYQKELGDARRRGLISVQAPAGSSLDQTRDFCRYYEKMLNESNIDLNEITGLDVISQMMSSLTQVRVIPQQPDRGKVGVIDLKVAPDNMAEKIQDRRKIILEAIGVPFEYVFGQSSGGQGSHKVNLRQYIRYCRRLKEIQDGIAWSLQRLYRTHLMDNGLDVKLADITVKFHNTINIAEMDRLEFLDANVGLLKGANELFGLLTENPLTNKYVNVSEIMRFYSKIISQMEGTGNIIVVPDGENFMANNAMLQGGQAPGGDPNAQQQVQQEEPQEEPQVAPGNVKVSGGTLPGNVRVAGGVLPGNVKLHEVIPAWEDHYNTAVSEGQTAHRKTTPYVQQRRTG